MARGAPRRPLHSSLVLVGPSVGRRTLLDRFSRRDDRQSVRPSRHRSLISASIKEEELYLPLPFAKAETQHLMHPLEVVDGRTIGA